MRILLLLFIAMPIVEMWLLIQVGGIIGALPTIGLVLLTACVGLALLRVQGANTLLSARQKLANNQVPAREMADGLFFAIGGALLLTPGFVTDFIGFACLTPGIRTFIVQFFLKHLFSSGRVNVSGFTSSAFEQGSGFDKASESHVIDGEYSRKDD